MSGGDLPQVTLESQALDREQNAASKSEESAAEWRRFYVMFEGSETMVPLLTEQLGEEFEVLPLHFPDNNALFDEQSDLYHRNGDPGRLRSWGMLVSGAEAGMTVLWSEDTVESQIGFSAQGEPVILNKSADSKEVLEQVSLSLYMALEVFLRKSGRSRSSARIVVFKARSPTESSEQDLASGVRSCWYNSQQE